MREKAAARRRDGIVGPTLLPRTFPHVMCACPAQWKGGVGLQDLCPCHYIINMYPVVVNARVPCPAGDVRCGARRAAADALRRRRQLRGPGRVGGQHRQPLLRGRARGGAGRRALCGASEAAAGAHRARQGALRWWLVSRARILFFSNCLLWGCCGVGCAGQYGGEGAARTAGAYHARQDVCVMRHMPLSFPLPCSAVGCRAGTGRDGMSAWRCHGMLCCMHHNVFSERCHRHPFGPGLAWPGLPPAPTGRSNTWRLMPVAFSMASNSMKGHCWLTRPPLPGTRGPGAH